MKVLLEQARQQLLKTPDLRQRFWTPDEDALIKEFYNTKKATEIAKVLHRSVSAVRNHANQLGLR